MARKRRGPSNPYIGLLLKPICRKSSAEQEAFELAQRLAQTYEHYEIELTDPDARDKLLCALLQAHVPCFRPRGRPLKLRAAQVTIFRTLQELLEEKGSKISRLQLARRLSGKRVFEGISVSSLRQAGGSNRPGVRKLVWTCNDPEAALALCVLCKKAAQYGVPEEIERGIYNLLLAGKLESLTHATAILNYAHLETFLIFGPDFVVLIAKK